jgi:hypothetical protein
VLDGVVGAQHAEEGDAHRRQCAPDQERREDAEGQAEQHVRRADRS